MSDLPARSSLRDLTPARVALGRTGASLPTAAALRFALDHANARDAVHAALDPGRLEAALYELGLVTVRTRSAAADRCVFLARPDLGRQLAAESRARLLALAAEPTDLAIVVADGLSARALDHVPALLAALLPQLRAEGWRLAPVAIATQGRVALGDEIARALAARLVLMLIGERPGLSSPDSLGAYLTYDPRPGQTDAGRNCVSNIRPAGLAPADAARTLAWLITEARRLQLTGVALKDESDLARLPTDGPTSA